MTAQNDKEKLLRILHDHGQQFLSAFDIPVAPKYDTNKFAGSESEEEWTGIGTSSNRGTSNIAPEDGCDTGFEQEDDDFIASSSRTPDIMIFSESTRKRPDANFSAKQLRKSFMSSKVTNVTSFSTQSISKEKMPDGESDDERTNTQNDALLHRLVHTKLLSASLNPELELNHAQKERAFAGRVLELVGEAKLGKGESTFREERRNQAAKRIRDGLVRKQKEQEEKALEKAKNLGNYHPTLKRLYDSNLSLTMKKKRARGLGMGIGSFSGGILKLRREEIESVTGSRKRSRNDSGRQTRTRPR